MNRLDIQINQDGDTAIVKFIGMADMDASVKMQQQLQPVIKGKASLVVLDLSQMDYMTSVSLGVLFWFNGQLRGQGRVFRIAALKPAVAHVLEAACVHRAMPVFKTVSEALTAPVEVKAAQK